MVDFLLAAGSLMHQIAESANKVIGSSPAFDTDFPSSALYDGIPEDVAKWASANANIRVDVDLSVADNGNFETWDGSTPDVPTGWTKEGSTTLTKETANPIEGVASVRVAGQLYRDYFVPSGADVAFRLQFAEYSGSTANAKVQIIDMETGEWLDEDGDWQSGATDLWTESTEYAAAGWDQQVTRGIVFTARPWSLVQKDVTRIRVRLMCGTEGGGNEGIFDDVSMLVVPNLMTVHGHNTPPQMNVVLRAATDDSFNARPLVGTWDTTNTFASRGAMTLGALRQPSFYLYLRANCPRWRRNVSGLISATSGFTNRSNGKLLACSFWIRNDGISSPQPQQIVQLRSGSHTTITIDITSAKAVRLQARDTAGTVKMDITSPAESVPPDTNWHHVAFSIDTTNSGGSTTREQVFIDGVNLSASSTLASTLDGIADFSVSEFRFAGVNGGGGLSQFGGALNELYIQPGYSPNLVADITKFRTSTHGDRVDLGSDGSTPSGSAAWFYHYGTETAPVEGFAINRGDGGGTFTATDVGSECMFAAQRFWRFGYASKSAAPANTPGEPQLLGQLVLTRAVPLPRQRLEPHPSPRNRAAIETVSPSGSRFRSPMSYHDSQNFSFEFHHLESERDAWIEFRARYGGGTRPVVIVPDVTKPDCHFGYLSLEYDETTEVLEQSRLRIEFREQPFHEDLT